MGRIKHIQHLLRRRRLLKSSFSHKLAFDELHLNKHRSLIVYIIQQLNKLFRNILINKLKTTTIKRIVTDLSLLWKWLRIHKMGLLLTIIRKYILAKGFYLLNQILSQVRILDKRDIRIEIVMLLHYTTVKVVASD
jgi:hypothetical protein